MKTDDADAASIESLRRGRGLSGFCFVNNCFRSSQSIVSDSFSASGGSSYSVELSVSSCRELFDDSAFPVGMGGTIVSDC